MFWQDRKKINELSTDVRKSNYLPSPSQGFLSFFFFTSKKRQPMMMLIESEIGTTHRHKTYATRLIKKNGKINEILDEKKKSGENQTIRMIINVCWCSNIKKMMT